MKYLALAMFLNLISINAYAVRCFSCILTDLTTTESRPVVKKCSAPDDGFEIIRVDFGYESSMGVFKVSGSLSLIADYDHQSGSVSAEIGYSDSASPLLNVKIPIESTRNLIDATISDGGRKVATFNCHLTP